MTRASPNEFSRHCAVLGLRHVESLDALNAAYRPLIGQWHPDRHHGSALQSAAAERAKAINAAYAYLTDAIASGRVPGVWRPPAQASPARATRASGYVPDGFPDESVLEIFIKSSSIVSVGYNSTTQALYLKFVGGRIYRYHGVPPEIFEELLSASSRGAYANAHIIYRFPYEPC